METLQRTANAGSVSTGSYEIDNSVKLEADNQEEFIRTPSSASNQKTWTVSMWFKRTELNNYQMLFGCLDTYCYFDTSNNLTINFRGASENFFLITNRLFRDTSAWYHIVVVCDFTNSTAADRGRLYINGVRETSFSNSTYQNAHSGVSSSWNSGSAMAVGGQNGSTTFQSCGYMAEVHGVDGSALTADSFGEFDQDSGIWKPKEYTGTYGTNGFYFKFDSPSDMGNDSSGNNNDFSVVNINQNDQATDTPTNNFCTLNQVMLTQANTVISQGATSLFSTGASGNTVVGTMGVSRGKWYWEFKDINHGGTAYWPSIGYTSSESTDSTQTAGGNSGYPSHVALLPNSSTFSNGTIFGGKFNGFSVNDIAGVALDMDNGDMYLYKNGTIQNSGNPIFTSIGDFAMPVGSVYLNGCGGYFNFGGFTSYTPASPATDDNGYGTFEYAPPTGYYALCTKNLAEFG